MICNRNFVLRIIYPLILVLYMKHAWTFLKNIFRHIYSCMGAYNGHNIIYILTGPLKYYGHYIITDLLFKKVYNISTI